MKTKNNYVKVICIIMVCVIAMVVFFSMMPQTEAFASENNYMTIAEDTAAYYGYEKTACYYEMLYNVNDEVVAVIVTFEEGGYIILDEENGGMYEANMDGDFPFVDGYKIYYLTHLNYYYKINNTFIHAYEYEQNTSETRSITIDENNVDEFYAYAQTLSLPSTYELTNALTRSSVVSGGLTYDLATDWINGKCGPTSAYIILEYIGAMPITGLNAEESINVMDDYIGVTSLQTLRDGMNDYCDDYNVNASFSMKSEFDINIVTDSIDNDLPIQMGGSIFPTDPTSYGHSVVIHGYKLIYYPAALQCTLSINNSWGDNDVLVTQDLLSMTDYWSDHVYFNQEKEVL